MDVYKSPVGQPKLKFGDIPFEFTPDPSNRWVRLADLIPWENFNGSTHFVDGCEQYRERNGC